MFSGNAILENIQNTKETMELAESSRLLSASFIVSLVFCVILSGNNTI